MKLKNLKTKFLGKHNFYYKEIDSTQLEIWRLYEQNAQNGTLVYADIQTNGKGTHGRVWYTDVENNIAFSFLIKLNCEVSKFDGLTFEIAQIIVNIFKENYNVNLSIKEPNDIVYNGKKVGGILTETKVIENKVKALVVGIGINTSKTNFSDDIKNIATSIKKEFNVYVDTENFIEKFCKIFERKIIERIESK